ncbi:Uncharacterised protein [Starkeya nomas]|uniref:Uncharacterized protein n=1 Tax=Starkeya nomas TaxID=2666134 RepID=A0A5S9R3E2_9HYPH|nr:hypothetical protein [Starkeya nomas]CAA0128978.1 Uncharacterised protein [Starkeya nomas]
MSNLPRIDGSAAWAQLSPEQQADIGAIAIELVAAWACDDQLQEAAQPRDELIQEIADLSEAYARAAGYCDAEMISALQDAVVDALPREIFFEGEVARIPSRLGPICRRCGCTEYDGCEGGCSWAEDDLCTACTDSRRHVFVSADAARAVDARAPALNRLGEAIFECTGCGSVTTDPQRDADLYRRAGHISCCPERHMVPLRIRWSFVAAPMRFRELDPDAEVAP